jgi:hypothetical protein
MGKYALLIGISEYPNGLMPLPAATQDVAAMARVLQNPELGNFDDVECLLNPRQADMAQRIERWFGEREADDLALLFFSGHGVKDERRKLYFAASNTEKVQGKLICSTALSASTVHDFIRFGKCKQQVVILDCCFSGAFGDALLAKDDGEIALEEQLGAEGRVVLASTSSIDYSFEEKDRGLSIYTRYLVEGIEKGAADIGGDGWISVDELHQFASGKVRETAPAMSPKIIMLKDEGYRIVLSRSPQDNPEIKYRRVVESCASKGRFSKPAKRLLISLRKECGLSEEIAIAIESEVLQPFREYQRKLEEYRKALIEAVEEETVLSQITITDLKKYQKHLGLRDEDTQAIEASLPGHTPSLIKQNSQFSESSTGSMDKEAPPSARQEPQTEDAIGRDETREKKSALLKAFTGRKRHSQPGSDSKVRSNYPQKCSEAPTAEKQADSQIDFSQWRIHPRYYLAISIISTVLNYPILAVGFKSIYLSVQMMKKYRSGDYVSTAEIAKNVRRQWGIIYVILAVTVVIYAVVIIKS